ncbi:hypothetical protein D2E26_1448 [Bifidobacterium dolichotidis]|uniref:Uncharacterized protein n=1 Tax=Bifidobacterium dolichotidis TaxID=2306976 RepID=A0A430FKN5_9BIFI|nr:hypothetical protein [Bifidobacterium dolichotidis]RSX53406.1 hypothetical protein D2E26_1448 [Bifidobacterium dolichotidis]
MHYFVPKRCQPTNKIMYQNKLTALQAAETSRIERGVELWVYRCEFCSTWHLTHHDPNARMYSESSRTRKPHSRKKGYKPRRR